MLNKRLNNVSPLDYGDNFVTSCTCTVTHTYTVKEYIPEHRVTSSSVRHSRLN